MSLLRTAVAAIAVLGASGSIAAAQPPEDRHRILIYGDSNTWGWVPTEAGFPTTRLNDDARFAGILAGELGTDYQVIVDGLNNRTTNLDEPQNWGNVPGRSFNGSAALPSAIATHMPLDLVIIMLGTNDAKAQFDRSAAEIATAAMGVAQIVGDSRGVATTYPAPQVLVIAPPPIGTMQHEGVAQFFAGGDETSAEFTRAFRTAGTAKGIPVFAAEPAMGTSDGFDGVHFTAKDHRQLGTALAPVVRELID